jgi:ABC-type molybdenum transport system ATPase subunit/photorepair protein PhrA
MNEVHEIKIKEVVLSSWAKSLGITEAILDPVSSDATAVAKAIDERDNLIRRELGEFVTGRRSRMDLEAA